MFRFLMMMIMLVMSNVVTADNKMYIDAQDMDQTEGAFRLHIGNNEWIETNTVHRDVSGLYTFESSIVRDRKAEYQKQWKCPYCYRYWPIGTKCGNADCPSKYNASVK